LLKSYSKRKTAISGAIRIKTTDITIAYLFKHEASGVLYLAICGFNNENNPSSKKMNPADDQKNLLFTALLNKTV
jgi:hypothetical protein